MRAPQTILSHRPAIRRTLRPAVRQTLRPAIRLTLRPAIRLPLRPAIRLPLRPPHMLLLLLALLLTYSCGRHAGEALPVTFNDGWLFIRQDSANADKILPGIIPNHRWDEVTLPHTAFIEPLVVSDQQWSGICWYKKEYRPDRAHRHRHTGLLFDGAMQDAIVYLNGAEIARHTGGYLPFYVNLTDDLEYGQENEILVRLDNRANPHIPPGQPAAELDYLWYSGLYRNVSLYVTDRLHITSPSEYHAVHGGGIMIGMRDVSDESATLTLSVHIANDDRVPRTFRMKNSLLDAAGLEVASSLSELTTLEPGQNQRLVTRIIVMNPSLWTPETPFLYTVRTELLTESVALIDRRETRTGIRSVRITPDRGLLLNGEPLRLTGTNRHQEYPYIGNALSDDASYRDAFKIREAGFNVVRSPHYPPSPAFLDACDELGLMVINSIPGWHYSSDTLFTEAVVHNTRMMCRRDRNHPSVVMWETSLNESTMPVSFLLRLHQAAKEELPSGSNLTSSRMDAVCDIYSPPRSDASPPAWWRGYSKRKPLFISEYGGYECQAAEMRGVLPAGVSALAVETEVTKSHDGGDKPKDDKELQSGDGEMPKDDSELQSGDGGELQMIRQALILQEAHNDNLYGPSFGDASWLAFDYNRGSSHEIGVSGIMNIFRLPKFAYWFYRSQADRGPVCFIAHHNLPSSGDTVRVYSNADTVALFRNDTLIAVRGPDRDASSANLSRPPFTFILPCYQPGVIRASATRRGSDYASHEITTPAAPSALRLTADLGNKPLKGDGSDVIFIYAALIDSTGNQAYTADSPVLFTVRGNARLIGDNPVRAEAGVAAILLRSDSPGKIMIRASSPGVAEAELMTVSR